MNTTLLTAPWLPNVITIVSMILGVCAVLYQVQQNQTATISAQKAHLRNELKVRTYELASARFLLAARKLSASSASLESPLAAMSLQLKETTYSMEVRPEDLLTTEKEAVAALNEVLIVMEQFEIAFVRFSTIRRTLSESTRRWMEAHSNFFAQVIVYLRPSGNGLGAQPLARASQGDLVRLQALCSAVTNIADDLLGYLVDTQIEAQNELLGDFFGRELPPREPADKNVRVLSRDENVTRSRSPGVLP